MSKSRFGAAWLGNGAPAGAPLRFRSRGVRRRGGELAARGDCLRWAYPCIVRRSLRGAARAEVRTGLVRVASAHWIAPRPDPVCELDGDSASGCTGVDHASARHRVHSGSKRRDRLEGVACSRKFAQFCAKTRFCVAAVDEREPCAEFRRVAAGACLRQSRFASRRIEKTQQTSGFPRLVLIRIKADRRVFACFERAGKPIRTAAFARFAKLACAHSVDTAKCAD